MFYCLNFRAYIYKIFVKVLIGTNVNISIRNPGRDISFPIFTREVDTKRIGKEIETIISRLNDLSSFLSNTEQNRN